MSKTKLLNVRIQPELKKRAKRLAEADGRSLSSWVTQLIVDEVEAAGRLQAAVEHRAAVTQLPVNPESKGTTTSVMQPSGTQVQAAES